MKLNKNISLCENAAFDEDIYDVVIHTHEPCYLAFNEADDGVSNTKHVIDYVPTNKLNENELNLEKFDAIISRSDRNIMMCYNKIKNVPCINMRMNRRIAYYKLYLDFLEDIYTVPNSNINRDLVPIEEVHDDDEVDKDFEDPGYWIMKLG